MNGSRYSKEEAIINRLKEYEGKPLNKGRNTKNVEYQRKLNYQPGYEGLLDIVAGLQKEVKRINQCLTLDGAQAYASKRRNWEAFEDDITGPNGKPDGIKEVIVTDASGNLKVVNGYGLTKTQYPTRKAYRTLYKTPLSRKQNNYSSFKDQLYELSGGFNERGQPTYKRAGASISPEFANIQPEIKPKDIYKTILFKPMYDSIKQQLKENGFAPMAMAQLFNKGLSFCYKKQIRNRIIENMADTSIDELDEKTVNRILRSKDYKEKERLSIFNIATNPEVQQAARQDAQQLFGAFLTNGGETTSPYKEQIRAPSEAVAWSKTSPEYVGFNPAERRKPEDVPLPKITATDEMAALSEEFNSQE